VGAARLRASACALLAVAAASSPAFGARIVAAPAAANGALSLADAMAAAEPGDSLVLLPGVYRGSVTMRYGVSIVGLAGPDSTILDADGGRYVLFCQGLDSTTVISGLTLRNGKRDHPNSGGGGIYLYRSSPLILNNIFHGHLGYLGPGIYCNYRSHPVAAYNRFRDNEGYLGGAFAAYGDCQPLLYNNIIAGNRAVSGGGIMLLRSAAVVLHNTVIGNIAADKGGAAIYCNASPALIEGNVLAHHETGPAVFWLSDEAPATMRRNVVWGSGGSHGGACPSYIGRDGNCEEDPGYVDWESGDFTPRDSLSGRSAACLAEAGASTWDQHRTPAVPDSVLELWRRWRVEHAAVGDGESNP
jgi:hypothetical protein